MFVIYNRENSTYHPLILIYHQGNKFIAHRFYRIAWQNVVMGGKSDYEGKIGTYDC